MDLQGKGKHVRSVPIPAFSKTALDAWTHAAGIVSGCVFRPVNKGDHLAGWSMTAQAAFNTVKVYAAALRHNNIAPHDLRRTFARLARKGKADLEEIQLSLGTPA